MEIILTLNLQDHEGTSHDEMVLKFSDEVTVEQVMEEIKSTWYMNERYQRLYYNGVRIKDLDFTLKQLGLKQKDVIIVKHACLPTWNGLLKGANTFKETQMEEQKKIIYNRCHEFVKELNDVRFFSTYPDLSDEYDKVVKMLFTYYDRTRGAIEESARKYFEYLYRGRNPKIKFSSRLEGTRRGRICFVEVEDTTIKYYIKTHHGGGARDSHTREDLDLKELLAYKILQELGVGPEILFIPNEVGSRWILYIASRDIPSFKTIQEVESSEADDLSKYTKAVVQMLFLYTVLSMGDHHSANMGVDSNGSPFIVDFFILKYHLLDVRTDFYDKVRDAKEINKVLGTFQERLEIAKNYLKESDFVRKIDEMMGRFLNENKRNFEEHKLYFENEEKTNDLKSYVQTVKENALKFSEFEL